LHNDVTPKIEFLTHAPCHAWSGFPRATHPPRGSWRHLLFMKWGWVFLREHLKNVHFKFYS